MHIGTLLALAIGASTMNAATAQEPVLLSQPELDLVTDGTIWALAKAPDGSIYFGGDFLSVNGVARANIAKLRPDGSLDPDWNPGVENHVNAIAVDSNGSVYAGGSFLQAGGIDRKYLAKFDASGAGAIDANWDARASASVDAIAIDSAGAVFVGGHFFEEGIGFPSIGGQPRNFIAKLMGNGDADPTWNPNPQSVVAQMLIDDAGSIFIASTAGGQFVVGGSNRYLAKLSSVGTGEFDVDWNPSDFFNPKCMALDGMGHLYLVVDSNGQNLQKVTTDGVGANVPGWSAECATLANFCIPSAVAIDASGRLYVAGLFLGTIGGALRDGIARLNADGSADPNWISSLGERAYAMTADSNSRIVVGGSFNTAGGLPRSGLAILSDTGSALAPTDIERPGEIWAFAEQPDGSIIVGGIFKRSGPLQRRNLLRIRPDNSVDPDWRPDPDGGVYHIAVGNDEKVYIAGGFFNVGGQRRVGLAKLASTGVGLAATDWDVGNGTRMDSIAFDSTSNALFVAGAFNNLGGVNINNLAKVGVDGVVDTQWNPALASNAAISSIVTDDSGSLYVGGNFSAIGGVARRNLARLSTQGTGVVDAVWAPQPKLVVVAALGPDGYIYLSTPNISFGESDIYRYELAGAGARDTTWHLAPTYLVNSLAFDIQNNVVYASSFTESSFLVEQHNLIRTSLAGSGATDPNWQPAVHKYLRRLLWTSNDHLLVGGKFDSVDGQARAGFAVFGPDEIFVDGFD